MFRGMGRIRRPEYTGENRCLPCTVFNLLVGAGASVTLGVAVSPGVGGVVFGVFAAVIYVRGYLVPGTPAITARYFPGWLLEAFGKEPGDEPFDESEADTGLLEAGRTVERAGPDDLRLLPDFRAAWNARIRELRGTDIGSEHVADVLGVDPAVVSETGRNTYAVSNERLVEWPSDAALLADAAAGRELRTRRPDWDELDVDDSLRVLARLRTLRNRCPGCGERLSASERTVTSCCQPTATILSVTCDGCETVVAEVRRQ